MKRHLPAQHLTDAEFSDLLAGQEAHGSVAAHLAQCDFCRDEVQSVSEAMSSFETLSSDWAAKVAPSRIPVPSRLLRGLNVRPTWGTGLAVTALTGILVFFYGPAHRAPQHTPVPVVQYAPAAAPSTSELAQDNKLMQSIDQELAYQAQPTVSATYLSRSAAHTAQHSGTPVLD